MNGEILHMGRLTLIARQFLKTRRLIDSPDNQSVEKLTFHVRNKYFGLLPYGQQLEGLNAWLDYLIKKHCVSIFLILPDEIDEHDDLTLYTSFINSNAAWVIATNTDRDFSVWRRHWKRLPGKDGGWSIDYYEKASPGRDPLEYHMSYDPDELPLVLDEIRRFALEIGCRSWAERFEHAAALLAKKDFQIEDDNDFKELLPPGKLHLLEVLSQAWVFGGTGSWNEEVSGIADDQDRKSDYRRYSWSLYRAIMRGLMYCFNDESRN